MDGTVYGVQGRPIGSFTRKYVRIMTPVGTVSRSRALWYMHYGKWPSGEIDHINGDTHDDSLDNLRECARVDNAKNRRKYRSNKSGYKGVCSIVYKGKVSYIAKIQNEGKPIYLGCFDCKHKAAEEYNKACIHFHGEFASLNIIER